MCSVSKLKHEKLKGVCKSQDLVSELDFLLAGISHYLTVRFGPAEGHTLHWLYLLLYFPQKLT